jgi:hypothetical protein
METLGDSINPPQCKALLGWGSPSPVYMCIASAAVAFQVRPSRAPPTVTVIVTVCAPYLAIIGHQTPSEKGGLSPQFSSWVYRG